MWMAMDGRIWLWPAGKGGRLAVFRNDGQGHFRRFDGAPWNQEALRDQTTVLGWNRS